MGKSIFIFPVFTAALILSFGMSSSLADIPNFRQVSPTLWRGGTPDSAGIAQIAALGVKTIIDLQTTDREIGSEITEAATYGMKTISIQLAPLTARPSRERLQQVIDAITDPANGPTFVHCKHGQDRTGVAVGFYRVLVEGWNPTDAYDEAVSLGFHPQAEIGLKCGFDEMMGLPVAEICHVIPIDDPD